MRKESTNKKNIFSPKNLLIGFGVVIVLLLVFNYSYPFFSDKSRYSDQGSLFAGKGKGSSSNPDPKPECTYDPECPKCKKCSPDHNCVDGPFFDGLSCGDKTKTCLNGNCVSCPNKCPDCQSCSVDPLTHQLGCFSDSNLDSTSCGDSGSSNSKTCKEGVCLSCNSNCGPCKKCGLNEDRKPECRNANEGKKCGYSELYGDLICSNGKCGPGEGSDNTPA